VFGHPPFLVVIGTQERVALSPRTTTYSVRVTGCQTVTGMQASLLVLSLFGSEAFPIQHC
jgi:hypothetical protein